MLSLFPHERRISVSQFSSPTTTKARRKPRIAFDDHNRHTRDEEEDSGSELTAEDEHQDDDDEEDVEDEDEEASLDDELAPLLPIFESSHLGLHQTIIL